MDAKKRIFSGIQPTGNLTLGNYIGALRNFKLLEDEYDCLYSIVDLHAITIRQDPAQLRKACLRTLAIFLASGLDPEKNIIFFQSHVHEHAELAWILDCYTYMGELSRMTQFKDKSRKHADNINCGLFAYPVLMAADILLYQADLVPIGSDQKQHLELARNIAERFNALYSDTFVVPDGYFPKVGARVMSLQEPTRKMSKSDPEDTYIAILDPADVIRKKLRRAVTDCDAEVRFDPENKPGVSNLMSILSALTGQSLDGIAADFAGKGYGAFKDAVADAVIATLAPIQQNYEKAQRRQGLSGIGDAERRGARLRPGHAHAAQGTQERSASPRRSCERHGSMNANEAIRWIHSRRYTGHKNGLENTRALLAALGNPERGFLSLHIAGTNGKGSTAAMCASCLQKSGYVTGLYTSPYLENYRERIRVNGQCIPEAALLRGVREIMAACAALERTGVSPTTFEIGTALAFWYFREAGAQVAVVECGLGGRLDCTNVITPIVSMIAAIGMDHMAQLGDTIEDIAREKAGIIKPGVPAVVMRQSEEILNIFREKGEITVAEEPEPVEITPYGSRFRLPFGEFSIRLPGRHQMRNASLALYGLRASGLTLKNLEAGLREAEWPGRLEWLGDTLLDGAHNPQGARTLREYLEEHFPGAGMTLITGMMRDKQVEACAACSRRSSPAWWPRA